jgi:3-oxoacyl-[acyl-carrier protein] reductase
MTVVISGATGGVGIAITKKFALKGHDIIILGRDVARLKKLRNSIKKDYEINIQYYQCDISVKDSVNNSIKSITSTVSSISLLINAAGVFPVLPVVSTEEHVYDNCMDVNIKLPFFLSRGLFGVLKSKNGGKVINIGSSSSYAGFKNTVLYCASKHAILGYSRALNDEWKEYGITVHCISPGTIDTSMANSLNQDSSTYITVDEFSELVYDVNKYDGNMLVEEVRATRRVIK